MPKKLLLAEDSLTIRKAFELALSRSDFVVTAVDNGEDAVRLAGEILPDLVAVDLALPGKNGFAVAEELRAMERTEKIPVLILSGSPVPLDEEGFKASGARGVLFKPFESRELIESIERHLREGSSAPESRKLREAPAIDEHWDFSDVMNEVEAEAAKSAAPGQAAREGLLPGAILPGGGQPPAAFNEFDVSIDEIEGQAPDFSSEPLPPASAEGVGHLDGDVSVDSPSPVTDLSPALEEVEEMEEVEEIEEIEHFEEVEVPLPSADSVASGMPASLRIFPVAGEPVPASSVVADSVAAETAVPEPAVPEHWVAESAAGESHPAPSASSIVPSEAASRPGDAELREFFAGRAAEIFRTVASEAVEKVMWEMTDRLAAEFSAKLRESVEAVAWEVIPSTAEALIREEIARIRGQAGKPSP